MFVCVCVRGMCVCVRGICVCVCVHAHKGHVYVRGIYVRVCVCIRGMYMCVCVCGVWLL